MDDALLSVAAAAARLCVSERQVRDLIRDGKLPYVNVGLGTQPAYRLRPADLEAFILQRTAICQKSEASTNAPAPANGSMTSKSEVIDFAARRAQRPKPKGGRRKPAPKGNGRT